MYRSRAISNPSHTFTCGLIKPSPLYHLPATRIYNVVNSLFNRVGVTRKEMVHGKSRKRISRLVLMVRFSLRHTCSY